MVIRLLKKPVVGISTVGATPPPCLDYAHQVALAFNHR